MSNKILEIQGLKKYFSYKNNLFVKAVDGINIELNKGETLGLVGESGSGKSTVAYTVIGIYKATAGKILYKGQDINCVSAKRSLELKGEIQIVFQDPGSSLNPHRTVKQTLDLPLRLHRKRLNPDFPSSAEELLQGVGLSADYLSKYPDALSGGERQLIAITRSLATNPEIILLDEPTASLDVSLQARVINRLLDLQKSFGLSYLFITHDLSLMRNVADRVAIMYLGKICELATAVDFLLTLYIHIPECFYLLYQLYQRRMKNLNQERYSQKEKFLALLIFQKAVAFIRDALNVLKFVLKKILNQFKLQKAIWSGVMLTTININKIYIILKKWN